MRVDIGNNLFYITNYDDNTLPRLSESFESILSVSGRGQLIEASFKFDSEKVLLNMVIDNNSPIEMNLKELKSFYNLNKDASPSIPGVSYLTQSKVLMIKFNLPIQYSQSIEFFAKTNDGNKTKKLKGYILTVNKEVE